MDEVTSQPADAGVDALGGALREQQQLTLAQGVLMAVLRAPADEALAELQRAADEGRVPVQDLCRALVALTAHQTASLREDTSLDQAYRVVALRWLDRLHV